MSGKPLTQAQIEGNRRRCLNGVCAMTPEEKKARKLIYKQRVMDDPFRRKLYADYFRKRRKRPGVREKTNEQARARYNKDLEKSRKEGRDKYHRMMADPVRHAEYLKRKAARKHGSDGKMTASAKRAQIREKLIPRWKQVVFDGRDEAYMRRTTPENARLFLMWRDNFSMFELMLQKSYRVKKTA